MCSKKKEKEKNSNGQNLILANLSKHTCIIANEKKKSNGQNLNINPFWANISMYEPRIWN